jgi:hypothetical protein
MSRCNDARATARGLERVKRVILDKVSFGMAEPLPEGKARGAREARDFVLSSFSYARPLCDKFKVLAPLGGNRTAIADHALHALHAPEAVR